MGISVILFLESVSPGHPAAIAVKDGQRDSRDHPHKSLREYSPAQLLVMTRDMVGDPGPVILLENQLDSTGVHKLEQEFLHESDAVPNSRIVDVQDIGIFITHSERAR